MVGRLTVGKDEFEGVSMLSTESNMDYCSVVIYKSILHYTTCINEYVVSVAFEAMFVVHDHILHSFQTVYDE